MTMWRSEVAEDLLSSGLIDSSVVGLHMGALDFAILNHQCITLATVLTEDSSTVKSEVEVLGELTGRIAKKADFSLGGWVKGCAPGFHDEWIIDRDNEDLAGILKLVAADIARDMGSRARRAEGCGHANNEALAGGELLGQVYLITGRAFDKVDTWDGITDFDHIDGGLMEGSDRFVCWLKK